MTKMVRNYKYLFFFMAVSNLFNSWYWDLPIKKLWNENKWIQKQWQKTKKQNNCIVRLKVKINQILTKRMTES